MSSLSPIEIASIKMASVEIKDESTDDEAYYQPPIGMFDPDVFTPEIPFEVFDTVPELNPDEQTITKDRTLIVFDWDDTIMCTSFMIRENITVTGDAVHVHKFWPDLDRLSKTVIDLINDAHNHGEVVIITAAEEGWVQLSAQKFMPELVPVIKNLRVISARTAYEKKFPGDPYKWKYGSMKDLVDSKKYPMYSRTNLVSFGDSLAERQCTIDIAKITLGMHSKTVKFSEKSTIQELTRQLDLIRSSLKYIVEFDSSLDLQLTVTKNILS